MGLHEQQEHLVLDVWERIGFGVLNRHRHGTLGKARRRSKCDSARNRSPAGHFGILCAFVCSFGGLRGWQV